MKPISESWTHDFRFAVRSLARRPGFSLVAILTLAIGLGANTAVLSVAHGLLWRSLPFDEPDEVVLVSRAIHTLPRVFLSIPTARDIAERNRVFSATAMFRAVYQNLTSADGEPERQRVLAVSHALPEVLGVRPALGRTFSPEDDRVGAPRTVLISHELWARRFGADRDLIGRTLELDDLAYTVVGVLPPGVSSENLLGLPLGDVWMPIGLYFDSLPVDDRADAPGLLAAGRLRSGESYGRAVEDLDRITRELAAEFPLIAGNSRLVPLPLGEAAVGNVRPATLVLLAAAGFLLLIICANLAHLLLARTLERRGELATRWALGASRWQLVRVVLLESLLVAVLGGALGWLAAWGLRDFLAGFLLAPVGARDLELTVGGPILPSTAALALLVGLAVGLAPAVRGSRLAEAGDLRSRGSTGRDRLRNLLLATEIALATALTVGSVSMVESFAHLRDSDLGFETRDVLSLQVTLPMPKYQESWAWVGFFDRLDEELRQLAGVRGVGMTTQLPLVSGVSSSIVAAGDRGLPPVPEMTKTRYQTVSAGFFQTMGIPLLDGRTFEAGDDERLGAEPVVIVNRSLARHFWPGGGARAVGQRIAFEFKGTPSAPQPQWRTIVGVVGDARHVSPRDPAGNAVYTSYTQPSLWHVGSWPTMVVVLKTAAEVPGVVEQVRARLDEIDPRLPFHDVQTLDGVLGRHLGRPRLVSALLGLFSVLALSLSAVGIYGIVAFTVAHRTREVGTRMALGASPKQVLQDFLRRHLPWIGLGITAGVAISAALAPVLASELYGVRPLEPWIVAGVVGVLGLSGVGATAAPCRQAARIDPAAALREE